MCSSTEINVSKDSDLVVFIYLCIPTKKTVKSSGTSGYSKQKIDCSRVCAVEDIEKLPWLIVQDQFKFS
jgi:hypothetical protein